MTEDERPAEGGEQGAPGSTTPADPESTHPADAERRPGAGGPETALVVGADAAEGRATALAFREEGWRVYATARSEEDVADLADQGCLTDELDVAAERDVRRVLKRVTTEADRLDCLVVAGGESLLGPIEEVPVEDARAHFDRRVFGPYRLLQRAVGHMRDGGDGTIVVVSSVLGRVAVPGMGVHGGAQFALEGLCDGLRAEVEDDGVDVVLVQPAVVEADLADPERGVTDYEWVYDLLADVRSLAHDGPGVAPPERVGAAVVNAASATMPAPRYPVGPAADVLSKTRYLPADWRDLLFGAVRRTAPRE